MSNIICLVEGLNFNFQQISSRIHAAVIVLKMELAEHRHPSAQQSPGVLSFHMPASTALGALKFSCGSSH